MVWRKLSRETGRGVIFQEQYKQKCEGIRKSLCRGVQSNMYRKSGKQEFQEMTLGRHALAY